MRPTQTGGGGYAAGTVRIESVQDVGAVIRAVRKSQGVLQDQIPGVSHKLVLEIERGKATAHIGKVLDVLRELGVHVHLNIPAGVYVQLPSEGDKS